MSSLEKKGTRFALSALAIQVAERPVTAPLTALVVRRGWGLLPRLRLPAWLEVPLAVTLLDYTPYLWHILVHRVIVTPRMHGIHQSRAWSASTSGWTSGLPPPARPWVYCRGHPAPAGRRP